MTKLLPFETTVVPSDPGQLTPVAVALATLAVVEVVLVDTAELELTEALELAEVLEVPA